MIDIHAIVKIVNLYGDGKHTIATPATLQFFEAPYVNGCVQRALAGGRLSEADLATAKQWLNPQWKPKAKPKTLVRF